MENEFEVGLSLKAQNDLISIATYYKLQVGPASAKKITDKLLDKIELLGSFPDMGAEVPAKRISAAGFRMLVVGEYLCFYRREQKTVIVHHIVHGSTDYVKNLFAGNSACIRCKNVSAPREKT